MMRPFLAVDAALFRIYRDMTGLRRYFLTIQFIIALAGVYGAYRMGAAYGGLGGGVLIGGLAALLPLFVDFADMTRPYSDAWSLGLLAMGAAAVCTGLARPIWTGVFLGLAVTSRIEMVTLLPVILWQFACWPQSPATRQRIWKAAVICLGVAFLTVLICAPWLLTHLLGNLRTIATVRVTGQFATPRHPRVATLADLLWYQGLGPALMLALIGLALVPKGRRLWIALLLVYAIASVTTLFEGPYEPFRYHAFAGMVLFALTAVVAGNVFRCHPKFIPALIVLALALPLVQSALLIAGYKTERVPVDVTAWIERHVPPGSRVVLNTNKSVRCVLPTSQAADTLWAQVTDDQAWRKKFQRGLTRFGLFNEYIPRAMSEQNLAVDRAVRRRYFILGGNPQSPLPRYDLQIFSAASSFDIQDVAADFRKSGGLLVHLDFDTAAPDLGQPLVQWLNRDGHGIRIWCSPDLRGRLQDQQNLAAW
jgi:hypothetical protein